MGTSVHHPGVDLAKAIDEFLADGEPVPTVAEFRGRAISLDSIDELQGLFKEVASYQLDGAPMVDEDGHPTVLGDFIRRRWSQVKAQKPEAAE
jgi:hypothetical protein